MPIPGGAEEDSGGRGEGTGYTGVGVWGAVLERYGYKGNFIDTSCRHRRGSASMGIRVLKCSIIKVISVCILELNHSVVREGSRKLIVPLNPKITLR